MHPVPIVSERKGELLFQSILDCTWEIYEIQIIRKFHWDSESLGTEEFDIVQLFENNRFRQHGIHIYQKEVRFKINALPKADMQFLKKRKLFQSFNHHSFVIDIVLIEVKSDRERPYVISDLSENIESAVLA